MDCWPRSTPDKWGRDGEDLNLMSFYFSNQKCICLFIYLAKPKDLSGKMKTTKYYSSSSSNRLTETLKTYRYVFFFFFKCHDENIKNDFAFQKCTCEICAYNAKCVSTGPRMHWWFSSPLTLALRQRNPSGVSGGFTWTKMLQIQ